MDTEGSNLSPTGTTNFIVLDSQTEGDTCDQNAAQNWPALQVTSNLQEDDSKEESQGPVFLRNLGETSGDEVRTRECAMVLVTDSEMEGTSTTTVGSKRLSTSDGREAISESEDQAEITVIENPTKDQKTEPQKLEYPKTLSAEKSDDGSGSSFHTNSQAGLGSYNQAELSRSQLRGQRFPLERPDSPMGDLFGEEKNDDLVSTPSEHLGSLQLSSKPMLVPETVDDDGNIIPPSPEIYGSQPIIIPSSPTDDHDQDHTVYNPAALSTFNENMDQDLQVYEEVEQKQGSEESSGSFEPQQHLLRDIATSQELQYMPEKISTFADDAHIEEESLRLHYTETNVGEQDSVIQYDKDKNDHDVVVISPDEIEKQESQAQEEEIDESQQFQLHISPSQSEKSQAYRATQESQGHCKGPEYVPAESSHKEATREQWHDQYVIGSPKVKSQEVTADKSIAELILSERRSLSQPIKVTRSPSNVVQLDSVPCTKNNSIGSDTTVFHLSLPKDGVLLHPVDDSEVGAVRNIDSSHLHIVSSQTTQVIAVDKVQNVEVGTVGISQKSPVRPKDQSLQSPPSRNAEISKAPAEEVDNSQKLSGVPSVAEKLRHEDHMSQRSVITTGHTTTIGHATSQQTALSQQSFTIKRPDVREMSTENSEDNRENVFQKTKTAGSTDQKKSTKRYALQYDSDEEMPASRNRSHKRRAILADTEELTEEINEEQQPKLKKVRTLSSEATSTGYRGSVEEGSLETTVLSEKIEDQTNANMEDVMMEDTESYQAGVNNVVIESAGHTDNVRAYSGGSQNSVSNIQQGKEVFVENVTSPKDKRQSRMLKMKTMSQSLQSSSPKIVSESKENPDTFARNVDNDYTSNINMPSRSLSENVRSSPLYTEKNPRDHMEQARSSPLYTEKNPRHHTEEAKLSPSYTGKSSREHSSVKRKHRMKVRSSSATHNVSRRHSKKHFVDNSTHTASEKTLQPHESDQTLDPFQFHGSESQFPPGDDSVTKIKERHPKSTASTLQQTPVSSRKKKQKLSNRKLGVKSVGTETDKSASNAVELNPVTDSLTMHPSTQISNPHTRETDAPIISPLVGQITQATTRPHLIGKKIPEVGVPRRSPSLGQYTQAATSSHVRTSSIGQNIQPLPTTIPDTELFRAPSSIGILESHTSRPSVLYSHDQNIGRRGSVEHTVEDTSHLVLGARTPEEKDEIKRFHVIKKLEIEIHEITEEVRRNGKIIRRTTREEKKDPVLVKITRHEEVSYVTPEPSPSRSTSTMTSGDLGDVSSSLSRSSVGSRGSKLSLNSGSLDRTGGASLDSVSHTQPIREESMETTHFTPPDCIIRPDGNRDTSKDVHIRKDSLSEADRVPVSKRSSLPSDIEMDSPHDVSAINKTGSDEERLVVSVEGRRSPDTLFTSPDTSKGEASDRGKGTTLKGKSENQNRGKEKRASSESSEPIPCAQSKTRDISQSADSTSGPDILIKKKRGSKSSSESDYISPVISYQDQAVTSASVLGTKRGTEQKAGLLTSDPVIGTRILAKWKDGYFYPGKISKVEKLRYHVKFDDGTSLMVKLSDIFNINIVPEGQPVMVQSTDDELNYDPGIVVSHAEKKGTRWYTVEKDDGTQGQYTFSQLILSEDQASFLASSTTGTMHVIGSPTQSPLATRVADVSLDNLVEGRRRAGSRYHQQDELVAGEEPQTSGHGTSSKRETKRIAFSESRQLVEVEEQHCSSLGRKRGPRHTSTPTPKGKFTAGRSKGVDASPVGDAVESPVGPRRSPRKPRVGLFEMEKKNIFRGMAFLLTHVEKTPSDKRKEKRLLKNSSVETSTDESHGEEETVVPFDKDSLRAQIEAGGGVVLDKYDEAQISAARQCFLLSNDHQKTLKYLQCLAAGIPCVSHIWIKDSFSQGQRLSYKSYMLPAGLSLEKKKTIEWNAHGSPLKGLKVFIVSEEKKFQKEWSFILNIAQCDVLPKLPVHGTSEVYCVVTDTSCPPSVLRKAKQCNVPLVSTQWIIQTLIHGYPMDFTGHPSYKHDYVEDR